MAAVIGAAGASPGNNSIRCLLDDFRLPLLGLAGDAGAPVESLIVELPDLLYTLHKSRKRFELRPLVVRRTHRYADIDRLLDMCHGFLRSKLAAQPIEPSGQSRRSTRPVPMRHGAREALHFTSIK